MADYKLNEGGVIFRGCLSIPNASGNSDWNRYQAWLARGNTPDPADPLPPPPVTPPELEDGIGAPSRAEMNRLKGFLRARFGY